MKSGVRLISRHRQPGCAIVDAENKGRVFYCSSVDSAGLIDGFTITNGRAAGIPPDYEISYDDGSPEFALALNDPLDGGAVKFTPVAYPVKIGKARMFITGVGDPRSEFRVCIYDDDGPGGAGGTLLASIDTTGLGANRWSEVDFSLQDIYIDEGDFYVGVIWLTGASEDTTLYLGLDLNGTFEDRSWLILDGGADWDQSELHSSYPSSEWMIRAKVHGPVFDMPPADPDHDFSDGGGIYCTQSRLTIDNCIISYNVADDQGGGIFCDSSDIDIENCVFHGNSAETGGGIYVLSSSPSIAGCTFALNRSETHAGAIVADGAGVAVHRSIVAFNEGAGALSCLGSSTATLSCSNVYGNSGGDWDGCITGQDTASGNLSEDPLFCNADSSDFRIDLESFCAPANSPCGLLIGGAPAVECLTPVECWGFSAEATGDGILVSWNTSPGGRPLTFEVQKSGRAEGPFRTLAGEVQRASLGRFEYRDCDVLEERVYWYRLIAENQFRRFVLGPVSAVLEVASNRAAFSGNYPNPFQATTRLYFQLDNAAHAIIRIYNSSGVLVREIAPGDLGSGVHTVDWDGRDAEGNVLSSGVYFCKFISDGTVSSSKLIVIE
jgi:hypothetical protein